MSLKKMFPVPIKRLLEKTNLTPKERHLLMIADLASRERDGKALLSKDDKLAIMDNWQPPTAEEADEFNRYNQAWRSAITAELDAKTHGLELLGYADSLELFSLFVELTRLDTPQPETTALRAWILVALKHIKDAMKRGDEDEQIKQILSVIKPIRAKIIKDYAVLLAFEELFTPISAFYQIDLSYNIKKYIEDAKINIDNFNKITRLLLKEAYKNDDAHIHINEIEPDRARVALYAENILKLYLKQN